MNLFKRIAVIWFKRNRWRFIGSLPKRSRRVVFLAGPHTSYRDFIIAIAIQTLTHFQVRIVIDEKHWRWYSAWLLKSLNAIKIPYDDETYSQQKLVRRIQERDKSYIVLVLNRSSTIDVNGLALFYEVVQETHSDLVLVAFDHRRKVVKFHSPFQLSGHRDRDMSYIRSFFQNYYSFYLRTSNGQMKR